MIHVSIEPPNAECLSHGILKLTSCCNSERILLSLMSPREAQMYSPVVRNFNCFPMYCCRYFHCMAIFFHMNHSDGHHISLFLLSPPRTKSHSVLAKGTVKKVRKGPVFCVPVSKLLSDISYLFLFCGYCHFSAF
jgi:hypothetical protein